MKESEQAKEWALLGILVFIMLLVNGPRTFAEFQAGKIFVTRPAPQPVTVSAPQPAAQQPVTATPPNEDPQVVVVEPAPVQGMPFIPSPRPVIPAVKTMQISTSLLSVLPVEQAVAPSNSAHLAQADAKTTAIENSPHQIDPAATKVSLADAHVVPPKSSPSGQTETADVESAAVRNSSPQQFDTDGKQTVQSAAVQTSTAEDKPPKPEHHFVATTVHAIFAPLSWVFQPHSAEFDRTFHIHESPTPIVYHPSESPHGNAGGTNTSKSHQTAHQNNAQPQQTHPTNPQRLPARANNPPPSPAHTGGVRSPQTRGK